MTLDEYKLRCARASRLEDANAALAADLVTYLLAGLWFDPADGRGWTYKGGEYYDTPDGAMEAKCKTTEEPC